jgi:hypothetical protein
MNTSHVSEADPARENRDDLMSALFAHMVMQQSNLALMLLGKAAHPETGQLLRDMEGAKLFIDQLEMLEAKTKGNLSKEEADLLKQTLMALRMAFVEAVNSPPPQAQTPADRATPSSESPKAADPDQSASKPAAPHVEPDFPKRFTKKY